MRTPSFLLLAAFASVLLHSEGAAQERFIPAQPYGSDILSARPVLYFLGVPLGIMGFQHLGSFSPSCDCEFKEESGMRFLFGGEFSVVFPKIGIAFRTMVAYHDYSADFVRKDTRLSEKVGENPPENVEYENISNVQLRYLTVAPTVAWYIPFTRTFVFTGLEFGFPMKYKYNHIENIVTSDKVYYDGSRTHVLLEETEMPGGSKLRVGIALGIGADIVVTPMLYVTPQAGLTIPLTTVAEDPSKKDWRVFSEYAAVIIKFRL
jgi:hypothetical protein